MVVRISALRRTPAKNIRYERLPDSWDRNLAPISDVTSRYDSINGGNLVVIRRLT